MLTSPGFLWMLMVQCAPAVAAASVLSHRLVASQLWPRHSDQRCVESGKHILDILECDVEFIYRRLDFNHITSALIGRYLKVHQSECSVPTYRCVFLV